jgi:hypothetical protein
MTDTINYKRKQIPCPTRTKDSRQGEIAFRQHNDGHLAEPNYAAFVTFMKRDL